MGFTTDESSVRVDAFKPSGKWVSTFSVQFKTYDNCCIHDAFKEALRDALGVRLKGMTMVCIEPYHQYSHPISLVWDPDVV